eukprot:CAMPEP_0184480530 /NCGR_PEP_ID=MMETSP0113_2-20130426/2033_1 /TAXON_ID=91329 /ORGANISM="Norrisiella sphaerica, Strain BC52" /LENGTH=548 /DNA_ID=CAMNT_0026859071 /DNA_START=130 /DNA_END=1774 /DNA_ORIENTATION=-
MSKKGTCNSSSQCAARNAESRDQKSHIEEDFEREITIGHRGLPSVSSMFPYGPGSTDPSEWPLRSFYKRELPDTCVRFGSERGIRLFQEALASGGANSYFPLAEQFRTQDEPAFCGLSTLVMVLNSLAIDPGRIWKGGWRWFSEEMLDCCESLENIRKNGISFDKLSCLASCNGAEVETWHPNLDPESIHDEIHLRDIVRRSCATSGGPFLIACYSRAVLSQTGDGHFSPIAAYHEDSDMVLIMDTARFKYPPHWVPLKLLLRAMREKDKESGQPRGYMRLSRASGDGGPSSSVLFVLTLRKGFDESALRSIRRFFASVRSSKIEQAATGATTAATARATPSNTNAATASSLQSSSSTSLSNSSRACKPSRISASSQTPPPSPYDASPLPPLRDNKEAKAKQETLCKICSSDGLEVSEYVSCFFSAAPAELLSAVSTVVNEFRVEPRDLDMLHVRPKYQEIVSELLRDIRALPVFPHVVTAASQHQQRLEAIVKATHGLELLTVLLLAAPVEDLSACGSRVYNVMRESEEGASEIVRNEIRALRNQIW